MVIKAAKVLDSAYYRETPAWTLTVSMPALPAGWHLLQKPGGYLGDTVTLPLPRPINRAVLSQGCVTSPDSFPFVFNPLVGHNVSRWNIYSSFSPPIRKLAWLFLGFLIYFGLFLGFLIYFCLPLGHAAGKALWQVPSSLWPGLRAHIPSKTLYCSPTSLPHDTQYNPAWRPPILGLLAYLLAPVRAKMISCKC